MTERELKTYNDKLARAEKLRKSLEELDAEIAKDAAAAEKAQKEAKEKEHKVTNARLLVAASLISYYKALGFNIDEKKETEAIEKILKSFESFVSADTDNNDLIDLIRLFF